MPRCVKVDPSWGIPFPAKYPLAGRLVIKIIAATRPRRLGTSGGIHPIFCAHTLPS